VTAVFAQMLSQTDRVIVLLAAVTAGIYLLRWRLGAREEG